jgi:hypothetical protein
MAKKDNIINQIDRIKDYFAGLQFYNGRILITAQFDPSWVITDGTYKIGDKGDVVIAQQPNDPLKYFLASNDKIELSDIIDLIEKILEPNLIAQRKINLFNIKVNELRNLINMLTLEESETITFKYKHAKKKIVEENIPQNIEIIPETSITEQEQVKENKNKKKV